MIRDSSCFGCWHTRSIHENFSDMISARAPFMADPLIEINWIYAQDSASKKSRIFQW